MKRLHLVEYSIPMRMFVSSDRLAIKFEPIILWICHSSTNYLSMQKQTFDINKRNALYFETSFNFMQ